MAENSSDINKKNPSKGKTFQLIAKEVLEREFGIEFESEVKMDIGNPSKGHKYDLATSDRKVVVECKCYSWTKSGNVPSAKLGFLNEAAFYLSFLPANVTKIIVIKKDYHEKKKLTLAQYYFSRYKHLLQNIQILEIDETLRKISWEAVE
ncbi:hypothetical protein KAI78_03630 [bacterium]|nr:hypothetical protein [bacterium]